MIRAARQMEIMAILRRDGVVSVTDLAKFLKASFVTVRRDLVAMERTGLLVRTHGGATAPPVEQQAYPSPYPVRETEHAREKALIALKATEYIKEGDSIIMNAGTTMRELARKLRAYRELRVVTNGLTVATELAQADGIQVTMVGGMVDPKKLGTVGPLAEESLRDIHVVKAFLGVTGISTEHGLSMHSPIEAQVNKWFVRSAQEITVLVDSSKFKVGSLYRIVPLREIHRIITDGGIGPGIRREVEALGVELIVVADEDQAAVAGRRSGSERRRRRSRGLS